MQKTSLVDKKQYAVIYRSLEHFEVLGFVTADSIEDAKDKAKKELLVEAKHYVVTEAEIAELKDLNKVSFDISA